MLCCQQQPICQKRFAHLNTQDWIEIKIWVRYKSGIYILNITFLADPKQNYSKTYTPLFIFLSATWVRYKSEIYIVNITFIADPIQEIFGQILAIAYLPFCATLFCTPRNVYLELFGTVQAQICQFCYTFHYIHCIHDSTLSVHKTEQMKKIGVRSTE